MKILNNKIGDHEKIFLIAEIGINHNGSINNAIKMIDYAKSAGFDAVKFQTMVPELLMQKDTPLVKYQKKTNSKNMFDLIKKYNFSRENFISLKKYCDKKKIIFLSTPFDSESATFLNKIKLAAFKISSTDNDNFSLLKQIKSFNKPIILSTGMMTHKDLKKTLKFLKLKKDMLSILHCISEYPTPIQRAQINSINALRKFKYVVGFSDHTEGNICTMSAVTLGAKIIEKHITLNKNMEGPDHSSSLECKDLNKFVSDIRELEIMLKIKKRSLTKAENETKLLAKKALYYTRDIFKNSKIKDHDLIALRPRLNGISPSDINKILKKKIYRNVKKNSLIKFSDFSKKV